MGGIYIHEQVIYYIKILGFATPESPYLKDLNFDHRTMINKTRIQAHIYELSAIDYTYQDKKILKSQPLKCGQS